MSTEPTADKVPAATTIPATTTDATTKNNNNNSDGEPPLPSEQKLAAWYEWPLFSWVVPLLERGARRSDAVEALATEDMMRLPRHEDPAYNLERIRGLWQEQLAKRDADPEYKPDIVPVLMAVYSRRILIGAVYRFISDGCAFALPFLLREYTRWLVDTAAPAWHGWMWTMALVLANLAMAQGINISHQHTLTAFTQMRGALRLLVFEAALRYPANHEDTGKIMAAHSSDTASLTELAIFVHGMYISPVVVLGACVALYFFIGYSGLIVFAIMFFSTPLQGLIMSKVFGMRGPFMLAAAKRANTLSEALQGIRIAKFMCWEESFATKIAETRDAELEWYVSMQRWRIPLTLVMMALPAIINFCAFAIQLALEGRIDVRTAFPALTMLNAIRIPLMFIPLAFSKYFDTKVALTRVSEVAAFRGRYEYLERVTAAPAAGGDDGGDGDDDVAIDMKDITVLGDDNSKKKKPQQPPGGGPPPTSSPVPPEPAKGASAAGNNKEEEQQQQGTEMTTVQTADAAAADPPARQIVAKDLTLRVPKGKLTIVVGATASGKSTLIKALIGEADVVQGHGRLRHFTSTAYIPQEPWIMNATARDNILMDMPFDADKYKRVVAACQLTADFEQLPGGDMTEIGERGINVSGGQKQRIAFARAVYSGRDTVLMDDPLSAVDPHVSAALFEKCICGEMRERTRVLVTHQAQLVPSADYVVLMAKCAVAFAGSVEELRASGLFDVAAEVVRAVSDGHGEGFVAAAAVAVASGASPAGGPPTSSAPAARTDGGVSGSKGDADGAKKAAGELQTTEDNKAGAVGWSTYSWYLSLGSGWLFGGVLGTAALTSTCFVIAGLVLALWASSKGVAPGSGALTQEQYMQWMGIFTLIGSIFLIVRQFLFLGFTTNVARGAHDTAMRNVLRAPTSFFDTTPMGRILNRFTKDIGSIDGPVAENLIFVINMAFLVMGSIATVAVSAPYILILVPFIVMYFVHVFGYYSNTVRGLKRLDGSTQSPVVAILNEAVGGLASIRAFGIGERLSREHERRALVSSLPNYCMRACQRWLSARSDLVGSLLLLVTCIFGVITRYSDTSSWLPLTPALVSLAITNVLQTTNTVTLLTRMLADLETEMSSTERVKEYADELPQEAVYEYGTDGRLPAPGPSWPATAHITFDNVLLRYRPGLPLVLNGVSFAVSAGHKVGLVGRTGSGKSTIMLALFRMVELAGGAITIDGRDTSTLDLADLRRAITIIPQDPTLFSGTIRSNLDPFERHTDETLWAVLDKLHLRDRLTKFIAADAAAAVGLQAVVREKGSNFSVGERQLLCMARALLKRSSILLLDEASASLDNETDQLIQRVIRSEFKQCTVITIAHRLGTVIDSDMIVVMNNGTVQEMGAPSALLADGGGALHGMVRKLGSEQFELLKAVADGTKEYAAALRVDTTYETK